MSKKNPTKAELLAELNALRALRTQSNPVSTTGRTVGFRVTRNNAHSAEYGIEYVHIAFVDNAGNAIQSAPTKESDPMGFEAKRVLKGVRYGQSGRGKFRFDRKAMAWSGQAAYVPAYIRERIFGTK